MKKILLLSMMALLFLNMNVWAQEETNYLQKKNEINVQVDDIFAKGQLIPANYYYDELNYMALFAVPAGPTIAVGYKRHFEKGAFRGKLGFGTYGRVYQNEEENGSDYKDDLKYASHQENIAIGYEWHSNFGRTQIFFGIDGYFAMNIAKTTEYDIEGNNTNYYIETKQQTVSFGAKPFIGFKFYISPKFSVSSEYHLLVQNYTTKNTEYYSKTSEESSYRNAGVQAKFGPMGQLTFSFHF